jgi:antitoxin (DNA-binding transcriptional repressor) of toxin-antitoxin stability system
MTAINVHDAKTHLSQLIDRAQRKERREKVVKKKNKGK